MEQKTCTRCQIPKPLTEFSVSRRGVNGRKDILRSECKPCNSSIVKKWIKENAEKHAETKHRYTLKKTYGLTIEQWNAMLAAQGGVCAICGLGEVNSHGRTGTQFRLSVDHCHTTGLVRGILCQKCNRGIGLLGDDVQLLQRAIAYLQKE